MSNRISIQELEVKGYLQKWWAEVMSDILMNYVECQARPEENEMLVHMKSSRRYLWTMFLVKEFLHRVGLKTTEKMFEVEAGYAENVDESYDAYTTDMLNVLQPSTADEKNPPLLVQMYYIAMKARQERDAECGLEPEPPMPRRCL